MKTNIIKWFKGLLSSEPTQYVQECDYYIVKVNAAHGLVSYALIRKGVECGVCSGSLQDIYAYIRRNKIISVCTDGINE